MAARRKSELLAGLSQLACSSSRPAEGREADSVACPAKLVASSELVGYDLSLTAASSAGAGARTAGAGARTAATAAA